jgi:DNA-binding winged helix-turn-helix (wHTH) protein/tetratricopeptide (TPR) repeat protein
VDNDSSKPELLRLDRVLVDLATGRVIGPEPDTHLSGRELSLLRFLAAHPGQTLSRETLLTQVFEFSPNARTRVVSTTLARLRAKLQESPKDPVHLVSVYGEGVRFEAGLPADTGLVGREQSLSRLLRSPAPVLWVHGTAGVGKTSLLRQAQRILPGTWVSLEGADSIQAIAQTVSGALGLIHAETPLQARLPSLGPLRLYLDGAQASLLVACLPAWLERAPELRVLVASQGQAPEVTDWESMALAPLAPIDAERVLAMHLSNTPTQGDERATLLAHCRGIPLSLVLFARQVALLGPRAVLQELERDDTKLHGDALLAQRVSQSLAHLSPQARAFAALLSSTAHSFPSETVLQAFPEPGAAALGEWVQANLVDRQEDGLLHFPLVRAALREQIPAHARQMALLQWAQSLCRRWHPELHGAGLPQALHALAPHWPALLASLQAPGPEAHLVFVWSTLAELSQITGWPGPTQNPPDLGPANREALDLARARFAFSRKDWPELSRLCRERSVAAENIQWAELELCVLWFTGQGATCHTQGQAWLAAQSEGRWAARARLRWAMSLQGPQQAQEMLRALTELGQDGDAHAHALALVSWARVLSMRGDMPRPGASLPVFERAVALLSPRPVTRLKVTTELLYAQALLQVGKVETALQLTEQVRLSARNRGLPHLAEAASNLKTSVLNDSEQWAQAKQNAEQTLERSLSLRFKRGAMTATWTLGLSALALSDGFRALECQAHLQAYASESPSWKLQHLWFTTALCMAGDLLDLAEEGAALFRELARPIHAPDLLLLELGLERLRLQHGSSEKEQLLALERRLHDPSATPEGSLLETSYDRRAQWRVLDRITPAPPRLRATLRGQALGLAAALQDLSAETTMR